MLNQNQTPNSEHWDDNSQPYLPKLTALFIEGLVPEPEENMIPSIWLDEKLAWQTNTRELKLKCPLSDDTAGKRLPIAFRSSTRISADSSHINDGPNETLRTFMCGISNCFNNLFMGIWGNISLIHISSEASHPVRPRVAQMERLIQNGAVLIHIVFGYLAENHTAANQLRLKQLLQEINDCALSNDEPLDLKTVEACMLWASKLKSPRRIARSMARVFEQLLRWIDAQRKDIMANIVLDTDIQSRLHKIDVLIKKGNALIGQLKLYAGDTKPDLRPLRIKALIKKIIGQVETCHAQISIKTDLTTPLPDILADRSQLTLVLQQIICNAIDAMPQDGQLEISARTLKNQRPGHRFTEHPANGFIEVTIQDSGKGMSRHTQARIFEPFFSCSRTSKRVGLGLAVSSGIIRAHGGFIHVRSHKDTGSAFKLFLPTGRKNKRVDNYKMMAIVPSIGFKIPAVSCLQ